ncbi:SIMPL domain-containing protein [Sphingomonas morindae]|uniref:SIMPL domain-containing protein n=1 Tax=Sphingomonas morindae TaxID=1541170 RepID=A0ABY4X3F8_9SPHN|nr:SIMPL domain-containing protein [Sphingomonas morindae]USI71419.1 SIMPL domain-containing protein [Sphingomonas morindae]
MKSLKSIVLLGVCTALAGAPAAAAEISSTPIAGTRLDVSATGEVMRVPDQATVSAAVVTQAPTAARAVADNARRMSAAIQALRGAGIAERDIRTASLSVQPQYRYADGQAPVVTGYQASNSLSILFRQVDKVGSVIDTLVAAGINQIDGPDFTLADPEGALDAARTSALAKARARADLYARAAGLKVGRIVAIEEQGGGSPVRPVPMLAMARAEKANTPIAPGESKLAVTLSVVFELN